MQPREQSAECKSDLAEEKKMTQPLSDNSGQSKKQFHIGRLLGASTLAPGFSLTWYDEINFHDIKCNNMHNEPVKALTALMTSFLKIYNMYSVS